MIKECAKCGFQAISSGEFQLNLSDVILITPDLIEIPDVRYITGNVNAGEITTAVEVLRNTSTLVNRSAPGIVYTNSSIWVGTYGFAVPKNIKEEPSANQPAKSNWNLIILIFGVLVLAGIIRAVDLKKR